MVVSNKHVFWFALVLTAFVFCIGLFLGYAYENIRVNNLEQFRGQSEFDLLDAKIQNEIISSSSLNCDLALRENMNFSNRLYEQYKILDKYDEANKISDLVLFEHKKYDLSRALFWITTTNLKEKCNSSFHIVVYLYNYNTPRLDLKAKQWTFSKVLNIVQNDLSEDIVLVPLAGNNNIASIGSLMARYNVSTEELPVILIDNNIKITNLESPQDIENYLN